MRQIKEGREEEKRGEENKEEKATEMIITEWNRMGEKRRERNNGIVFVTYLLF